MEQELSKIGLNKSEIKVYLYLLKQGVSSPPQIAKGTGIARTNTYHLIRSLKDKGLIEENRSRKRLAYIARDPKATFDILERKRQAMEKILPDLRALHKRQENKPVIQFFEGRKGLIELYEKSVLARETIHAIGSTEKIESVLPGFLEKYQKQVKRCGLIYHDLLAHTARDKTQEVVKNILGALYEQKFLPEKYGDISTAILIWDDNVALITLEEPLFGTLITNQYLADTFRMLFKIIWTALPEQGR
jgi:HTH-type transcriptional regulator, sugar sensing transcriptional regulator